jgi:hypothetical protein
MAASPRAVGISSNPHKDPRITKANQVRFLEAFEEAGFVNVAAKTTKLSARQVFKWAQTNAAFGKKYAAAKEVAKEGRGAFALGKIREVLLNGKCNSALANLMMFLTKQADPSFRDSAPAVQVNVGPVAIMLGMDGDVPAQAKSIGCEVRETKYSALRTAQLVDKASESG